MWNNINLVTQKQKYWVVSWTGVAFDRCLKFERSNDQTQLIFGSLSVIQARDAISLPVSCLCVLPLWNDAV